MCQSFYTCSRDALFAIITALYCWGEEKAVSEEASSQLPNLNTWCFVDCYIAADGRSLVEKRILLVEIAEAI